MPARRLRALRWTAAALLWVLVALVASGCVSARQRAEGDVARSVSFVGNGGPLSGHNDLQLRQQIQSQPTSFGLLVFPLMYFVQPEVYRPELLLSDAYRLEVWYAHNGWFDARFQGWAVHEVRRGNLRRAAVVDVVGYVDPGEPSLVRDFTIEGLSPATRVLGATVRRTGAVAEGGQFNLQAVHDSREQLRIALQEHSYAYARVNAEMDAWPEEQAVDVRLVADPGPSSVYGPITVEGNEAVPARFIEEQLRFEPGNPYRLSDISRAQRRLFGLGTFSVVSVVPDLSNPDNPEVPIRVSVSESRFRTLRLGGGIDHDGVTLTPRLSAGFRHVNLFRQLVRFDARAEAGYAIDLREGAIAGRLPVYLGRASITHPRIFGPRWSLAATTRVQQDLQGGQFAFFSPEVDLDLTWRATDEILVTFGPHWEQFEYLELSGAAELAARALFGEGFRNPYRLTTLDARITMDWRDDALFTTRGTYYLVGVRQAVPFAEEDYFYTELSGDARLYRPVRFGRRAGHFPLTFAARTRGRMLLPWGDRAVPYPERVFLGGSTDLRGFRLDQVGPYDCLCLYRPGREGDFEGRPGATEEVTRLYLPRGGVAGGMVGGELRYDWAFGVSFAGFANAGLMAERWDDLALRNLRWGAGVGARYRSAVGPLRLDLAFRPLYPEDDGPVQFINCRPLDRIDRPYDLYSQFKTDRSLEARRLPFAVNLYIGIHEAF